MTTAPVPAAGVAAATIAGTPGRLQSLVSRSASTVRYRPAATERRAANSSALIASGSAANGGRSNVLLTPAAPAIAFWHRDSSSSRRHPGTAASSVWVKVWTPISLPSARIRRTSSGCSSTFEPMTKNVACA